VCGVGFASILLNNCVLNCTVCRYGHINYHVCRFTRGDASLVRWGAVWRNRRHVYPHVFPLPCFIILICYPSDFYYIAIIVACTVFMSVIFERSALLSHLLLACFGPDDQASVRTYRQPVIGSLSGKLAVCGSWQYSHSWKLRGREQSIGRQPEFGI